ncbi:MAG: VOC family protein [Gemmatimonadaceae bacterium]|nr:VOC family protein [Gloeobacterales cyanobacterium ES-bin-141]
MQITHCLHIALFVSDLERAEYFYRNILGLQKLERTLKFPGAWYEVGTLQVHLILVTEVPQDIVEPEKLGRNRHLAFAVTDLSAAKARLHTHGLALQMSASGRAALFVQDPDGNVVELSQLGEISVTGT